MSVPEPSWKIRTRACPFYARGRCIFSDACNFLHDAPHGASSLGDVLQARQPRSQTTQAPHITIHASSPRSVKSPPRSPRMQGLLHALKDVIGEDEDYEFEEEDYDGDDDDDCDDDLILATTVATPVVVNAGGPSAATAPTRGEENEPAARAGPGTIGATLSQFRSAINTELLQRFAGRTRSEENSAPSEDAPSADQDASLDTIHSPADTSISDVDTSSTLSGSASPSPQSSSIVALSTVISSTPSPSQSIVSLDSPSDPTIFASNAPLLTSPTQQVAHTLLSPVTLSSTTFAPLALLSFSDSAIAGHLRREGSIDSGYGERWPPGGPHFLLSMSPPRSPALSSTFDLLTSPFGSPSARFLGMPISPTFGPVIREVDIPPLDPLVASLSEDENTRVARMRDMRQENGLYGLGIGTPMEGGMPVNGGTPTDHGTPTGHVTPIDNGTPTKSDRLRDNGTSAENDILTDNDTPPEIDRLRDSGISSVRFPSFVHVSPPRGSSASPVEDATARLSYGELAGEDVPAALGEAFASPIVSSSRASLITGPVLSPLGAASRRYEAAMQASLVQSPESDSEPTLVADVLALAPPVGIFGDADDEDDDDDDDAPPSYAASIAQDDTFTFSEDGDVPDSDTRVHLPLPPAPDGSASDSDESDSDGERPVTPDESIRSIRSYYSSPVIRPENLPLPATPVNSRTPERPASFLTPPSVTSRSSTPSSRPFGGRVFTPPSKQSTPRRDTVRPRMESPTVVLRDRTSRSLSRPLLPEVAPVSIPSALSLGSPFREHPPVPFHEQPPTPLHEQLSTPFSEHPPTPQTADLPSSPSQTDEDTRTVPFGFRNSFTLGRATNSSLIQNRQARRQTLAAQDSPASSTGPITPLDVTAEEAASSQQSVPSTTGLRPFRLSRILSPSPSSSIFPSSSKLDKISDNILSPSSSVSSSSSRSLSSHAVPSHAPASSIPSHIRNSSALSYISAVDGPAAPHSAPTSPNLSWHNPRNSSRSSFLRRSATDPDETVSHAASPTTHTARPSISTQPSSPEAPRSSGPSEPGSPSALSLPSSALSARSFSTLRSPLRLSSAPPTPRPDLLFAIAADDPNAVRQVLTDGAAHVNESVGPQSALSFAMTNKSLKKRVEIVRTLLAFGANLKKGKAEGGPPTTSDAATPQETGGQDDTKLVEQAEGHPAEAEPLRNEQDERAAAMKDMDPVTRYYVSKAEDPQVQRTTALMERSTFKPLTQVRYDLIGQDRALEQLFRVLSMHSQQKHIAPIVVMLCGPSGYGKTLVARRFGSLLTVPTHTVNMINVRSSQDLWQAYSTSPDEEPSTLTLAEFLLQNEGKRCVVVLDEIEKIEDEKALWSLHMPWEMGRCQLEPSKPFADVRNVIWIGTSNIGDELVLTNHDERQDPEVSMSRQEYVRLMGQLRGKVSERLGAPLLSRVTTVLPFVPFTEEEKTAIAAEALFALGGDIAQGLSSTEVADLAVQALSGYLPAEGARSLYRTMSTLLMDLL